jgi:hypothetical protein
MSNYPPGAATDSAAPWNQIERKTNWTAHYILACDGNTDSEYEVSFPAGLDNYDLLKYSQSWCKDKGFEYLDHSDTLDKSYHLIETEEFYE